jgi:type I restriction enzyme S subunit
MKTVKLADIANIKVSNVDKKSKPGQKAVKLCNYTDVYYNIDITNDIDFMVATASDKEIEKFSIKKGQVALTKDSETAFDIGMSAYMKDDFRETVLGYHLALFTPYDDELDGQFLNYFMRTNMIRKYFENNAGGSGQRVSLSLDCLSSIPVSLPKLKTQKQIASLLGKLDDKIAINKKINEKLKKTAQTIYDYWFVQFDFPDENNRPYKTNGGEMVWSEELKREIPQGWKVENFYKNSFAEIIKPKIDKFYGKKIYLNTSTVNNLQIDTGEKITYKNRASRANMQPAANSIWFAKMQNSTKHLLIGEWSKDIIENVVLSTGFMGLRVKDFAFPYLVGVICNPYFEIIKDSISHGATMSSIGNDDMKFIKLVIPTNEILQKYNEITLPILKQIDKNRQNSLSLAELRNWLLPMLVNGQISIN